MQHCIIENTVFDERQVVRARILRKTKSPQNGQFSVITMHLLRNGLLQCFGTFKMPILMFISVLVFRPEGQIWNPVRRDTRIYVRRILNASRISKTQLNSCTISPS